MGVALWTTYYNPKNEQRTSEFLRCLKINAENPYVHRIYVLSEDGDIPIDNEKICVIPIVERPTYNTFFDNYKIHEPESVNVLLNTDIVLDYRHTSRLLTIVPKHLYALSRYEFMDSSQDVQTMEDILKKPVELFGNHEILKSQFYYSQDTWVVFGYPTVSDIFTEKLGVPNCDGRVAYRFNKLGYKVYNPCLSVFTYHIHDDTDRSHYLPPCEGNLLFIRPTALGAIFEHQISQVKVFTVSESEEETPPSNEQPLPIRRKPVFSFLRK